ncbi:hypothetical protein HNP24_000089 [Chryseobacterium sediminis]|uniref:Uncharacterized protein n=1 Tax=Chryseobacterium sediminis TaxID=1679494 RepID=A0ABR6PU92_9FLAO|nr:hypothetical protein [Chryseobacterium sediminis]MBB6329139.1 hypothetical protein [Chryseobacterium sediminis]
MQHQTFPKRIPILQSHEVNGSDNKELVNIYDHGNVGVLNK